MWRTAKADVAREMGIPPQHHHTTILRLSAIERHWYNRWEGAFRGRRLQLSNSKKQIYFSVTV
jgi:ribosomal protein S10